jgi:hypothetical protein
MEAVGEPNVTVATGGSVTVRTDDPLFPSLVAVIVAVPAATAVTVPVCETVATLAALVDHVTTRSVTTVPATFFTSTDSGAVWPTIIADVAGATTTDPTASGGTVIVAVPVFPSLVAVIVVPPGATAVTTPAVDTVATALFAELQLTPRPGSTFPSASFIVAVNVVVWPTTTTAVAGVTVTVATGAISTLTVAVPVTPSLVAVIVTLPGVTPVTVPVADTAATAVLLELHAITRSGANAPETSRTTAVSCTLAFCTMVFVPG